MELIMQNGKKQLFLECVTFDIKEEAEVNVMFNPTKSMIINMY